MLGMQNTGSLTVRAKLFSPEIHEFTTLHHDNAATIFIKFLHALHHTNADSAEQQESTNTDARHDESVDSLIFKNLHEAVLDACGPVLELVASVLWILVSHNANYNCVLKVYLVGFSNYWHIVQ